MRFVILMSIFVILFCERKDVYKYIDIDSKQEEYSIKRTRLNQSEFVDTKSIPYNNGVDSFVGISNDTFCVKNNNWYIKEFGKYHLFLGHESFQKDSLLVQLDKAVRKSDLGYWDDTLTIYPFSYIYRPVKKIFVKKNRPVYVYISTYYIYDNEIDFSSPETVFFDPEIGIVKTNSLTSKEIVLKGYPYLDSLKIE